MIRTVALLAGLWIVSGCEGDPSRNVPAPSPPADRASHPTTAADAENPIGADSLGSGSPAMLAIDQPTVISQEIDVSETVEPLPAIEIPPNSAVLPENPLFSQSPFDPFLSPLIEIEAAPELLSSLVDSLALGLISPEPSTPELTFLELLCRDQDIPDFVCRGRYGN